MTQLLFAMIIGCSKSTILKTTTKADLDQVGLVRTSDISAHYVAHQPISTEAVVSVTIDADGNKTFSNDNFTFLEQAFIDFDGHLIVLYEILPNQSMYAKNNETMGHGQAAGGPGQNQ